MCIRICSDDTFRVANELVNDDVEPTHELVEVAARVGASKLRLGLLMVALMASLVGPSGYLWLGARRKSGRDAERDGSSYPTVSGGWFVAKG